MSTAEVVWVNRNLAVLARLHRIRSIHPVWSKDGDGLCRMTVQLAQHGFSAVFKRSDLIEAFNGSEVMQSKIIQNLGGLIRSIAAHSDSGHPHGWSNVR